MDSNPFSVATSNRNLRWEEINCPLCGSCREDPLIAIFSETDDKVYRVVRCEDCGMAFLNPRPDEASIGHYYPDDYEVYQGPTGRRIEHRGRLRRYLEKLVRSYHYGHPPRLEHFPQKALAALAGIWLKPGRDSLTGLPYHGEGRLLDFGCGSGWYMRKMRDLGWQVTGIDFSEHAAREVARTSGMPVLAGTLPHPDIQPGSFDVITMGAVLEHVHHPHQVIEAAARALSPGGYVVISVPNFDSWGRRFFREDWFPLELPRHLLHFNQGTLRKLVEAHGLEVTELKMIARGGWMRRSMTLARRRSGKSLPRILARLGQTRFLPSLLTRWSMWRGQADCLLMIARKTNLGSTPHVRAA